MGYDKLDGMEIMAFRDSGFRGFVPYPQLLQVPLSPDG